MKIIVATFDFLHKYFTVRIVEEDGTLFIERIETNYFLNNTVNNALLGEYIILLNSSRR